MGAKVDGRVIDDLLDAGVKSACVEEVREVTIGVWKSIAKGVLSTLVFEFVVVIVPAVAISVVDISSTLTA